MTRPVTPGAAAGTPAASSQAAAAPFEALAALPVDRPCALLHGGGVGEAVLLDEPVGELWLDANGHEGAFARLREFLGAHADRRVAGWFGYDLRDDVEAIPRHVADDLGMPSLHVVAYGRERRFPAAAAPPAPGASGVDTLRAGRSRADHEAAVARVIEHIRAGDIFQANLTQPFDAEVAPDVDPRHLFWRACHASPAPFGAYLQDGRGHAVLSASPEEFLHVEDGVARSRPIKGTRPRGADAAADAALLAELLDSEKDLAELAMIVDLLRNDLGKVARPGTVAVGPFPEHDSFAQVHHLFATITARLREGVDLVDVLRATFPCGSITGAPKLRCMQILEVLEPTRRDVYTGAIGWLGPGPAMHLSVAIRVAAFRRRADGRGWLRLHTGGGITADSDPVAEYDECLHKAAGWLRALEARLVVDGA